MKHLLIAAVLLTSALNLNAQLPAGTQDATSAPSAAPSSSDDAKLIAINDALTKGSFEQAISLLTSLIAKHPDSVDPHLLYDLGYAQEALDQNSAAESAYRSAIAADPKYFEPHLALGLLLARSDKPAEARTELLAAVHLPVPNAATTLPGTSADPSSTPPSGTQPTSLPSPQLLAHAYRALAHLDLNTHPADARDELLAALKLSPETPDDALLAAQTAEALGDLPSAEAAYRRILAAQPNDSAATAELAHLLQSQNKPAEAEPLLAAALKAHPGDPALTAQLADLYAASSDPATSAKALPLVATLHTEHPEDAAITRLLARLYTQAGQPAEAEPLYTALLAASPNDPTLTSDLGSTLLRLKRYPEAQKLLSQSLANPSTLSPNDQAAALSDLAFAASENNDPATTLQALDRRATLTTNTAATQFLEATAYDKLHQTRAAIASYKAFLTLSNGKFPDQEWQASHRLNTLEHKK